MKLGRVSVALGIGLLASHVAAAHLLSTDTARPLTVEFDRENPRRSRIISGDAARLVTTVDRGAPRDDVAPGLRYWRFTERYRGGFVRSVGAAQLRGQRQKRSSPPCSIALRIGQVLLDDGSAGEGTVAHLVSEMLAEELAGLSVWPAGDFNRVETVSLAWAEGDELGSGIRMMFGDEAEAAPVGFVALHAELVFKRVNVPIFVALIPELRDGRVHLEARASAEVRSDNLVYRAVLRIFDGDSRATEAAQAEIGSALLDILEPPPPLVLPDGSAIRVQLCREGAIEFRSRRYAALPLAVTLENQRGEILPLELPVLATEPSTSENAAVSLELDINALGALLHQLWASGFLDRALADAALTERFNRDPDVEALLSVRARDLTLAGPPVITGRGSNGYDVAAEFAVVLEDGPIDTEARLFVRGALEVASAGNKLLSEVAIIDSALACRLQPSVLSSCYETLAAELSHRAPQASSVISEWLERSFTDLVGRQTIGIEGAPAELVLQKTAARADRGRLVIDFAARLVR